MKVSLLCSAAVLGSALANPAFAALQDCTITWNPNTEADLAGYRLYVAPTPGGYKGKGPALELAKDQTSAKCAALKLPAPSTYYFGLTAYDTSGNESDFSKEFSKAIADIPASVTAIVTKAVADKDGATVTIDGPATKLYVFTDFISMKALDNYVGGTSTYRYAFAWAKETFVCFVAENKDGVRTEQGCTVPVIDPPVDTVPPSAPTILDITKLIQGGNVLLTFNKGELCK